MMENYLGIVWPSVQTNNFELKLILIFFIQQNQFERLALEDPNTHKVDFCEACDTFKANDVFIDAIRLWLFPFSLQDKAK